MSFRKNLIMYSLLVLFILAPLVYYFSNFGGERMRGILLFSILSIAVLVLFVYLYKNYSKIVLALLLILLAIISIFVLTDDPPIITFKVEPENPKDVREAKVYITASDDRCLRINTNWLKINDFPGGSIYTIAGSKDYSLRNFLPRYWCSNKEFKYIVNFSRWPETSIQGLEKISSFPVIFTIRDSLLQKTSTQTLIKIFK